MLRIPMRRFATGLILVIVAPPLHASDHTWTGAGGDGKVSTAANWSPAVAPTVGEAPPVNLIFPVGTPGTVNQDVAGLSVNGLSLDGAAYTLQGLTITMNGGVSVGATSTNVQHILQVPLALTGDLAVTVGSGSLSLEGAISGPFSITTAGTVFLRGDNSYTGTTTLSSGTLFLVSSRAAGIGPASVFVQAGSTLGIGGYLQDPANPKVIQVQPGASVSVSFANASLSNLTFPGPGSASVMLSHGNLSVGSFDGPGDVTLTVGTLGATTISGVGSFSGTLSDNGPITVNGSIPGGAIILSAGSFTELYGSGTTGALTLGYGGISPTGILSVNGNATFTCGFACAFSTHLDGTSPGAGYSRLAVTGNLDLGSGTNLDAQRTYSYTIGDTVDIMTATGSVSGTFVGLPDGSTVVANGQPFTINYLPHSVRLTAAPPVPVELLDFSAE